MSKKIPFVAIAVLLALAGCRENPTIDPNNDPIARATIKGEDESADGSYAFDLDGDSKSLTLVGSKSEDIDGEITSYRWISGTLDPAGTGGRYIPEGEKAGWPKDGETTKVDLAEGFWVFHLYVEDNDGATSAAATLKIKVGDPDPIPMPGDMVDSGGGGGASVEDCIAATSDITSEACAECTCNAGGTCAADVAACNETCWGLISCVATECTSATDIACITGTCAPFLSEGAAAMAAGAPCATPCADECAM